MAQKESAGGTHTATPEVSSFCAVAKASTARHAARKSLADIARRILGSRVRGFFSSSSGGGVCRSSSRWRRSFCCCKNRRQKPARMRASSARAREAGDGGTQDDEDEYSLDEGIEAVGFGWFQIALLVLCGATQLADATELLVLSLLNNPVQCAFGVSKAETAWLASAVFAGMLCGAYVTGHVSDRYGRRVGFGMTTTLVASFGLISAGAPNFAVLVVSRFFVGVGVGGANAALSLYAEYLPTAMRGRGLILFFFFFSVGGVLEAGVAYLLMPDWRALLFATAIPSIFLVICFPVVPESPRFLVVHGRTDEAERCLAKAASWNSAKLPAGRLSRVRLDPRRYAAQPVAEIWTGAVSFFGLVRARNSELFYWIRSASAGESRLQNPCLCMRSASSARASFGMNYFASWSKL